MALPVDSPRAGAPGERIAKLLARAGVASRREIERMIADGRVALNGIAIETPATVLPSLDGVTVDGAPVAQPEPARLFLYHKPTGLLVTEHDPRGRPTIYDRLPKGSSGDLPRVVPVGRLDLATEGLLLLTTDGELKRQLELPSSGVERSYRARAYGPVSQAQLEELIEGVEIEGIRYGAIDANLERRTGANSWIELTLTEGKNREVRRVLEHLGLQVGRLIRTRYGPFILADLPPGEVGEVRQADLLAFRQTLATKAKNEARIQVEGEHPLRHGERDRRGARAAGAGAALRAPVRQATHPGVNRVRAATSTERTAVSSARRNAPSRPATETTERKAPARTGMPFKWRGEAPAAQAPQPNPGPRPTGPATKARPGQDARTPRRADPPVPSSATARPTSPEAASPRPAKPQRKSGWAKPKPKSGPPRRPTKPRA